MTNSRRTFTRARPRSSFIRRPLVRGRALSVKLPRRKRGFFSPPKTINQKSRVRYFLRKTLGFFLTAARRPFSCHRIL